MNKTDQLQKVTRQTYSTVDALPVELLETGMRLVFNQSYGESEVVRVEPVSEKRSRLTVRSTIVAGREYSHIYRNSTLVGLTAGAVALLKDRECS